MNKRDYIILPLALLGLAGSIGLTIQLTRIFIYSKNWTREETRKQSNWMIAFAVMMIIGYIAIQFIKKDN